MVILKPVKFTMEDTGTHVYLLIILLRHVMAILDCQLDHINRN